MAKNNEIRPYYCEWLMDDCQILTQGDTDDTLVKIMQCHGYYDNVTPENYPEVDGKYIIPEVRRGSKASKNLPPCYCHAALKIDTTAQYIDENPFSKDFILQVLSGGPKTTEELCYEANDDTSKVFLSNLLCRLANEGLVRRVRYRGIKNLWSLSNDE